MQSPPGPETTVDGKRYLYFGGTSYFGLHGHPGVIRAGTKAWQEFGTNTATIRSGMGTSPAHINVEQAVAEFFQCEDAVYVASGYLSNAAGLQALQRNNKFDVIFVDEDSHYCVIDAANMTALPVHTFAHREASDLRRQLCEKLSSGQQPLVLSDGLFPVMGEIAPLPDYLEALADTGGHVWLDDAHGAGVLGPNGRGTAEYFGIENDQVHTCGTLAKAFGGFGGFVAGRRSFIDDVRCSPVIAGASGPPSPIAAATSVGIQLVRENSKWREALASNARYLKSGLNGLGIDLDINEIPIAAFSAGDRLRMQSILDQLMDRGIAIQFVDYPGSAADGMLRVVVFSNHSTEQIDQLIDALRRLL